MSLRSQLQVIYDERGKLTAALVVDTARSKTHPLHSRFEWDNKIAGEQYRLVQAANMVRSVQIRYVDNPEPKDVRQWVSVHHDDGQRTYEPATAVAADPFQRTLVLREMEREWRTLERRFSHMQEFFDMIQRDLGDGAA